MPKKPLLTEKEIELIYWALNAGFEQHTKFLMHDDWDARMTKKQRWDALAPNRLFAKAIKVFNKKVRNALNRKEEK